MKLPEKEGPIRLVGLTGSIGTGKSTAAEAFRSLGVGVVDADQIAREVVAKGTKGLAAIVEVFGDGVLASDGSLDRAKLAARVFSDHEGRKRLEGITHPLVAKEVDRQLAEILSDDGEGFAVYDVPLLFEAGIDRRVDLTVVVAASREAQISRVTARSGLTREEVENRLAAQMALDEKIRRADLVLPNDGTIGELRGQVAEVVALIRERNRACAMKKVDK